MDIVIGIFVFIWLWLALSIITVLVYNAFKFLYINRMNNRSTDWDRDHPAKGYERDHRQPNFD